MDICIKPKVYVPVFAFLTGLVAIELALRLPGEWIILTLLAGLGFDLLVLCSILKDVPSPRPATSVFLVSYGVLAILAVGVRGDNSRIILIAPATVAAGLGILWHGIRRNRSWAWNWTRRIYTLFFCYCLLATAVMPFIPGKFRRGYVSDFGPILAIPVFALHIAIALSLLLFVRKALMTPSDASESAPATTGANRRKGVSNRANSP
jgi:hypothetical protein